MWNVPRKGLNHSDKPKNAELEWCKNKRSWPLDGAQDLSNKDACLSVKALPTSRHLKFSFSWIKVIFVLDIPLKDNVCIMFYSVARRKGKKKKSKLGFLVTKSHSDLLSWLAEKTVCVLSVSVCSEAWCVRWIPVFVGCGGSHIFSHTNFHQDRWVFSDDNSVTETFIFFTGNRELSQRKGL